MTLCTQYLPLTWNTKQPSLGINNLLCQMEQAIGLLLGLIKRSKSKEISVRAKLLKTYNQCFLGKFNQYPLPRGTKSARYSPLLNARIFSAIRSPPATGSIKLAM